MNPVGRLLSGSGCHFQTIAPASPAYWSLEGFRAVILDGGGMRSIVTPSVILLGISVVAAPIAATRFRFTDEKEWS